MVFYFFYRHGPYLLRHKPGKALMDTHPQRAYTFAAESESSRQNQIGAIRFQQTADICNPVSAWVQATASGFFRLDALICRRERRPPMWTRLAVQIKTVV